MQLDKADMPKMFLEQIQSYNGTLPTSFVGCDPILRVGPLGFMVIITSCNKDHDVAAFLEWHNENTDWFESVSDIYGGILFRGFNISSPQDFDNVIWNFHQGTIITLPCSCDCSLVIVPPL